MNTASASATMHWREAQIAPRHAYPWMRESRITPGDVFLPANPSSGTAPEIGGVIQNQWKYCLVRAERRGTCGPAVLEFLPFDRPAPERRGAPGRLHILQPGRTCSHSRTPRVRSEERR